MLPWRRPEPSPEGEGVLWGHLARVGARRRPAQPSFELVYSLSVCQLFRLSRFVPDFDVSGKTAEPKMAFNFAHLLSAACGGAPRRLGRLRRPWARCARLFWGGYQHRKSALFSAFSLVPVPYTGPCFGFTTRLVLAMVRLTRCDRRAKIRNIDCQEGALGREDTTHGLPTHARLAGGCQK